MNPRPVSRRFVVSMAFVFGLGFGALVLLGSGIASASLNKDDPFSFGTFIPGFGIILTVLAAVFFVLAAMRSGLRGGVPTGSRVRFASVLGIAATVWVSAAVIELAGALLSDTHGAAGAVFALVGFFTQAPGWIILGAAALAGWAFLGTIRWQYLNAETKQFA